MKQMYIQVSSVLMISVGFVLIAFLYVAEPRNIAEVTTKSSVAIGAYKVDEQKRARGIDLFRTESYAAARSFLSAADPESQDATTQFYIAYSFYREGWGRISNDDKLFLAGLEAINRVLSLDAEFRVNDPDLSLKTPHELKHELDEGLKVTASDFNPFKVVRERK